MWSRFVSIAIVSLPAILTTGCGSPYTFAPVSGKVTVDGQPIANLLVMFEPIGSGESPYPGPGSVGVTDGEGAFTLMSVPDEHKGAIVGKHRVRIMAKEGGPGESVQEEDPDLMLKNALAQVRGKGKNSSGLKQIPARYNMTTELTFEVPPAGTDSASFKLLSK